MADFRIHSLCVVKNEADIVAHCLRDATKWSDFIYVLDNGSTDGTWEIVQSIASDRIIPWKQHDEPFRESLRGDVFNHFRDRAREGDWWCRLDADEYYVDDPKTFLASVPRGNHVVWTLSMEYYLTTNDVEQINFDAPIEQILPKLKYYKADQSEPRFFRYRRRLQWPPNAQWPRHMGLTYPQRILGRHYKYRSPKQIQARLDTRRAARAAGFPGWEHASQADWREKVGAPAGFSVDRGDAIANFGPDVRCMCPDRFVQRSVKRVMHGLRIWP